MIYKSVIMILLFILNLSLYFLYINKEDQNILTVAFLDVGQGDAIYIETPNGTQALIDSGLNGAVLRELGGMMSFFDRSIDFVIGTHDDLDHIGGMVDVLNGYKISVINSNIISDMNSKAISSEIKSYLESNLAIQKVYLDKGDRIVLDKENNVFIDILWPNHESIEIKSSNDQSVVARLVYGETSFLFTGDISKETEDKISNIYGKNIKSDVLKVAHHGSDTSTSNKFLEDVSPEYAVIQVGENNRYGHPHEEVINTLGKFDIEILQTKNRGTIIARSNGEEIVFE